MKNKLLKTIRNAMTEGADNISPGTAVYGFPSSAADFNVRDMHNQSAIDNLNYHLSAINNCAPVINPYTTLNRVKNLLYIYGLSFETIHHQFKESYGTFVLPLTQYNSPYGANLQGNIRQDNGNLPANLSLKVNWTKMKGLYDIYYEVVVANSENKVIGEITKKNKSINEASLWSHFGYINDKGKTHDGGAPSVDLHRDVLRQHGLEGKHRDDSSKAFKKGWVKHLSTKTGHAEFEHDASHHGNKSNYHNALDNIAKYIKTAPHITKTVTLNLKNHNGVEDYSEHESPSKALRHLNQLKRESMNEDMDPVRDYGSRVGFLGKLKGAIRDYNKKRKQRASDMDKAYKNSMSPSMRVHYGGSMVKESGNDSPTSIKKELKKAKKLMTTLDKKGRLLPSEISQHKQAQAKVKKYSSWLKESQLLLGDKKVKKEDFSLKPKTSTDLEKRKVNNPNPAGGGYSRMLSTGGPKPEHYKRSGEASGTYKTATAWKKPFKSNINNHFSKHYIFYSSPVFFLFNRDASSALSACFLA